MSKVKSGFLEAADGFIYAPDAGINQIQERTSQTN